MYNLFSDACIITSAYKEDTISQLVGEVVYKNRVKNPEITFRAVGVGKWGNIRDRPKPKERWVCGCACRCECRCGWM
jgi:hypothetical protein